MRLWDVATATQQAQFIGHTGRVSAVAIAPDGTWLATTSGDRTVRIWQANSNRVVAMMRTDDDLSCCAWSPRGYQLTVGGRAGLYRFEFKPPNS